MGHTFHILSVSIMILGEGVNILGGVSEEQDYF